MTITEVRAAYREVRERARARAGDANELAYIDSLWAEWDATLAKLPEDAVADSRYVEFLTRNVLHPVLSNDAILEWLDAYPDAVYDRRPGGLFNPQLVPEGAAP